METASPAEAFAEYKLVEDYASAISWNRGCARAAELRGKVGCGELLQGAVDLCKGSTASRPELVQARGRF